MYKISYKVLAEEDLYSIFDDIKVEHPSIALEYIEKLEKTINLLSDNPFLGVECTRKNINRDCRVLIFENYLIFYQVLKSEIIILRVISGKQDYIRLIDK